ncbi:hypothetical protein BP6252_00953 [Coleophoma cylindrospora]|uniref:AAA+ ATPase domain-containing protein n=1 Tax=Coleophoma cylindrospora TaxID=1849047 RepID=A0A3D8SRW8_9HELO|nr:hypothetical protein BP6252_00953 [Coleophoma cylindrospora]
MSPYDDYIHVSAGGGGSVSGKYFEHSTAKRIYTEALMIEAIRTQHPKHHLTITGQIDLLDFAAGRADVSYQLREPKESHINRLYLPPARRYNSDGDGTWGQRVQFGSYDYTFQDMQFLVYTVEGRDGQYFSRSSYLLVAPPESGEMSLEQKAAAQQQTDALIAAATKWSVDLHDEVLVFDNGFWQKNKELWKNIQKANWADVILEEDRKKAIIEDVIGFFDSEKRYAEFEVPWKRGVIFYGPPGNGKTISTKALMHDLSKRVSPTVETLYVKSFNSYMGPEEGIRQIFQRARQMAPCLLILEDIDSLVSVGVRSYFFNEVDGLESNHGILMIGSTNHLERLDPGIAKRPSRFDRKYFFDNPDTDERIQYCEYWRHKLANNDKVDFPKILSPKIADITDNFSFAYLKEAFVAALLVIVAKQDVRRASYRTDDSLRNNMFWAEIKKQIESLRKEMEEESIEQDDQSYTPTSDRPGIPHPHNTFSWPDFSSSLEDRSGGLAGRFDYQHYSMPRYM